MKSNSSPRLRMRSTIVVVAATTIALTGCGTAQNTDVDLTMKLGVFFDPEAVPTTLQDNAVLAAVEQVNAANLGVKIQLVNAQNDGTDPAPDEESDAGGSVDGGPADGGPVDAGPGDAGSAEGETPLDEEDPSTENPASDDSALSAGESVLLTELKRQEVDAILAPTRFTVTEAIVAELVEADILLMTVGGATPESYNWVSQGLYFSAAPSAWLTGRALAEQATFDGGKFLGVIRENDFYSTLVQGGLVEELKPLPNQVVVDAPYAEGDRLFYGALDKALGMKPDRLVVMSEEETADLLEVVVGAGYPAENILLAGQSAHNFYPSLGIEGARAITSTFDVSSDFVVMLEEFMASKQKDDSDGDGAAESKKPEMQNTPENLSTAARAFDSVHMLALAAFSAGTLEGKLFSEHLRIITGGDSFKPNAEIVANFDDGVQKIRSGSDLKFVGEAGGYAFGRSGEATEGKFTVHTYNAEGTMAEPEPLNVPDERFIKLLPEPMN